MPATPAKSPSWRSGWASQIPRPRSPTAPSRAALRANTDEAAARGVFGVPTAVVDGRLFWGLDATDMLIAELEDPDFFSAGEYRRVRELPVGASRTGRRP